MIQTIFGSPVVFLKTDKIEEVFSKNANDKITECLMHPDHKFINHPLVRGGKLCTTDLNANVGGQVPSELHVLFNFLKNTALEYIHLYSDQPVKDLKCQHYWINLTFEGCEIRNHRDKLEETTEKSLIVTFYPKVPLQGAELVFMPNSNEGDWVSECLEQDLVKVYIEEGTIVIFDNFTLHAVSPHKVEEPRMCIVVVFTIQT